MKYKCPNCNFPVFNRRVTKCESCHEPLPQELLYSKKQMESIDAEFERNKAQAERFKRSMGVPCSGGENAVGGDFSGGGCDGGGGGDCA